MNLKKKKSVQIQDKEDFVQLSVMNSFVIAFSNFWYLQAPQIEHSLKLDYLHKAQRHNARNLTIVTHRCKRLNANPFCLFK